MSGEMVSYSVKVDDGADSVHLRSFNTEGEAHQFMGLLLEMDLDCRIRMYKVTLAVGKNAEYECLAEFPGTLLLPGDCP